MDEDDDFENIQSHCKIHGFTEVVWVEFEFNGEELTAEMLNCGCIEIDN